MEPLNLSTKLNKSSMFLRKKTFLYTISQDDEKTMTPCASIIRMPSLREEFTSPSPKKRFLPNKPNSEPRVPKIEIPLNILNIQNHNFYEPSPCRTEIQVGLKSSITMSSRSVSPISSRVHMAKSSFSRIAEKYEDGKFFEANDFQPKSARSGIYFRENSFEINEICDENSCSEQEKEASLILPVMNEVTSESSSPKSAKTLIRNISFEDLPQDLSYISLPSPCKQNSEISKAKRNGLSEINPSFMSISFEEALGAFKTAKLEYSHNELWHTTWLDKLCCRASNELPDESNEICEKLIIFAYAGYSENNLFHSRLLVSVYEILMNNSSKKGTWTEIGFSSSNPYENDLKHDMAALGLFQILFIDRYLPKSLEEALNYFLSINMSFILISFDISEICISVLRKKKLNSVISEANKALEVIFFLYAGSLLYWISLHKSHHQLPSQINLLVEKTAKKQPKTLISLARENFNIQCDRI